jgi:hypothetical protein
MRAQRRGRGLKGILYDKRGKERDRVESKMRTQGQGGRIRG